MGSDFPAKLCPYYRPRPRQFIPDLRLIPADLDILRTSRRDMKKRLAFSERFCYAESRIILIKRRKVRNKPPVNIT